MRHALQDPGKIFQMISDQFSSMNPENTKHSLGFSSILHNSGESSSRQENESSPKERLCVNLGNCSDSVRKSATEWQLVRQNVVQEGGGGERPRSPRGCEDLPPSDQGGPREGGDDHEWTGQDGGAHQVPLCWHQVRPGGRSRLSQVSQSKLLYQTLDNLILSNVQI